MNKLMKRLLIVILLLGAMINSFPLNSYANSQVSRLPVYGSVGAKVDSLPVEQGEEQAEKLPERELQFSLPDSNKGKFPKTGSVESHRFFILGVASILALFLVWKEKKKL